MITSIVTEIPISKKGELKFFEINIPSDVTLVMDPQAVIKGTVLSVSQSRLIAGRNTAGIIRLQSEHISDLYYNSVVTFGSSDTEPLLPGYTAVVPELLTLFYSPYCQNDLPPAPELESMEGYVLYGCYQDLLGAMLNIDTTYTVSLTLWTKLKTPTNDTTTGT